MIPNPFNTEYARNISAFFLGIVCCVLVSAGYEKLAKPQAASVVTTAKAEAKLSPRDQAEADRRRLFQDLSNILAKNERLSANEKLTMLKLVEEDVAKQAGIPRH